MFIWHLFLKTVRWLKNCVCGNEYKERVLGGQGKEVGYDSQKKDFTRNLASLVLYNAVYIYNDDGIRIENRRIFNGTSGYR